MAEYLKASVKNGLITLEGCTAASNIAAGTPVALLTGSTTIYTLGTDTTGFSSTALKGYHCIGILDEAVSAEDSPVTVWSEGVFELTMSSAAVSASVRVGHPVWGDSGTVVTTPGVTGDLAIGTIVNIPIGATVTGTKQMVKIKPGAYRWTMAGPAAITATSVMGLSWPAKLM